MTISEATATLAPPGPARTCDIEAAMRLTYCQPEWALFFDIANGTGFNVKRRADAIAMNMYPSRGLALHGFEFKISKGDWKRELADPQKAEEIAKYCDFWFVVTPPDIIGAGELPLGWGHIEFKSGKLRTKIPAAKQEPLPLSRSFAAALLRGQAKVDEGQVKIAVDKAIRAIRDSDEKNIRSQVERQTKDAREFMGKHAAFVQAMRDHRFRYIDDERFLRAIRIAIDLNLDGEYGGLKGIVNSLRSLTKSAEAAALDLLPEPTP